MFSSLTLLCLAVQVTPEALRPGVWQTGPCAPGCDQPRPQGGENPSSAASKPHLGSVPIPGELHMLDKPAVGRDFPKFISWMSPLPLEISDANILLIYFRLFDRQGLSEGRTLNLSICFCRSVSHICSHFPPHLSIIFTNQCCPYLSSIITNSLLATSWREESCCQILCKLGTPLGWDLLTKNQLTQNQHEDGIPIPGKWLQHSLNFKKMLFSPIRKVTNQMLSWAHEGNSPKSLFWYF